MAGDWIIFEHATLGKVEIVAMASRLGISPGDALMSVLRVWVWMDVQTLDCFAPGATREIIDAEARRGGFADAMEAVGWLRVTDDGIEFVNAARHNGQTAKSRALAAKRQKEHRAKATKPKPRPVAPPEPSVIDENEIQDGGLRLPPKQEPVVDGYEHIRGLVAEWNASGERPLIAPTQRQVAEKLVEFSPA